MKGSKAILELLEGQGVDVMFGYPGGVTIPIYDELLGSKIHHVLVRHEQCAAHMADGYSRSTGRTGVCIATSGPGATNLVTGVATAYADSSPMMVLTGQVATGLIGNNAFQEADIFSLMMPITKHNYRVLRTNDLPEAIKRGMGIANSGRKGPVHIDLPVDVQRGEIDPKRLEEEFPVPAPFEDFSAVLDAIKVLRDAERPALLVGGGARWSGASSEVQRLAEILMAPVITTIMAKAIIPEDHPLSLGMLGMHGRECSRRALLEADVILAIGARFSDRTIGFDSEMSKETKVVHLDIDPMEAGKNPRTKVRLVGDARKGLQLIIKGLGRSREGSAWSRRIKELSEGCICDIDIDEDPIKPQKAVWELRKVLAPDAFVVTEVGQNQMWAAHFMRLRHPYQFITSGGMGTMGFGFPASIGVKYAHRDKQVVDVAGDGSFQMVFQELATAMSEELPVVVCLLNNGWLGMVKQWQKLQWDRRYSSTELRNNPDFVKLAQSFGAEGVTVTRCSELNDAFKAAFASDVPFVVDVRTDPEEDMLPMLPGGVPSTSGTIRKRCRWSQC
ncbi:MAG: biosynthetic-type acetolactate synthase large subunit [Methanomassiliicoccales archaeon]|nr:biosynthetic-type acetolactate synthase large subunit [Methanomassiliicoccales archaeon]